MKTLFLIALIAAAHVPVIASIAAGKPANMTPAEMVTWAAIVSALGGVAAAWRTSNHIPDLAKTGANTAVLGASLVLLSSYWTTQNTTLAWSAIGLSGIISLGGLATVDWLVATARRWLEARADEHKPRKR